MNKGRFGEFGGMFVPETLMGCLEALEAETGFRAVVLLDDIASELDESRRRYLFELLDENKTQIFVTTTDRNTALLPRRKARFFHIQEGQITGE